MHGTSHRQHRHFVAVPLLIAAIVLPCSFGVLHASLSGGVLAEEEVPVLQDAVALSLPDGTQFLLYDGADVDPETLTVVDGSVLVSATHLTRIGLGDGLSVNAFDGFVHLTRYGDDVSVAALTAPVLIEQGDRRLIVPPQRQWRWQGGVLPSADAGLALWRKARETTAVPRSSIQEQIRSSTMLPPAADPLPAVEEYLPILHAASMPRLPAAQERVRRARRSHTLGVLRGAVQRGDSALVDRVFGDADYAALFADEEGRIALSSLLAEADASSAVLSPMITFLARDPDAWLLLSVHPRTAAAVWAFADPPLSAERSLVLHFALPEADWNVQAFDAIVLRRWSEDVGDTLSELADASGFLQEFVAHIDAIVRRMESSFFPERARNLVEVSAEIVAPYADRISGQTMAILGRWHTMDSVATLPVHVGEKESRAADLAAQQASLSGQSGMEPQFQAAQVEQRAKDMLENGGAVFTLQTRLRALGPTIVEIEGVLFSTPTSDRPFNLTLDTARGEVQSITESGRAYPYAMPLAQFASWAQR